MKKVRGTYTGMTYTIFLQRDGSFIYGYYYQYEFQECPYSFDTLKDAETAIAKRESFLANGETVMF